MNNKTKRDIEKIIVTMKNYGKDSIEKPTYEVTIEVGRYLDFADGQVRKITANSNGICNIYYTDRETTKGISATAIYFNIKKEN